MENFTFKRVTNNDLEEVLSLYSDSSKEWVDLPTENWLGHVTNKPGNKAYLIVFASKTIGYIQTERIASSSASISVYLTGSVRGKGYFGSIIKIFLDLAENKDLEFYAYIEPKNQISLKAFQSAGFSIKENLNDDDMLVLTI
jgi:RimJ/RimL family protein N-acetyltransferase